MVAVLTFAATYIDGFFNFKNGSLLDGYAGAAIRVLAWAGFALCTGTIGFGIWVIGHECEEHHLWTNRARSRYEDIEDHLTDHTSSLFIQAVIKHSPQARHSTTQLDSSYTLSF